MPGRKRPSVSPELSRAVRSVRELAVERELESQVHGASRSHRSECFESCIAQIVMMFAAPNAIRDSRRSSLEAKTDVLRTPCGLLQGQGLNAIVSRPVYLCDQYASGCHDWKLPFQIAGTNSVSGSSFQSVPELRGFSPGFVGKRADTASRIFGGLL